MGVSAAAQSLVRAVAGVGGVNESRVDRFGAFPVEADAGGVRGGDALALVARIANGDDVSARELLDPYGRIGDVGGVELDGGVEDPGADGLDENVAIGPIRN